jgi:hypothetical protein
VEGCRAHSQAGPAGSPYPRLGEDAGVPAYAEKLRREAGIESILVENDAIEVSSSDLRRALPERGGLTLLDASTYAYIIRKRLYCAKPDFTWLRARAYEMLSPRRIQHVWAVRTKR